MFKDKNIQYIYIYIQYIFNIYSIYIHIQYEYESIFRIILHIYIYIIKLKYYICIISCVSGTHTKIMIIHKSVT